MIVSPKLTKQPLQEAVFVLGRKLDSESDKKQVKL